MNNQGGRHCVLESLIEQYVPNNTFLSSTSLLHVVTGRILNIFDEGNHSLLHCYLATLGPNNSGKSCYLIQVALMTILAHLGCYVSAEYASFPVIDQIFTLTVTEVNKKKNHDRSGILQVTLLNR